LKEVNMSSNQVLLAVGWLFLGTAILGVIVFISLTFQLELFGWGGRNFYRGAEDIFNYKFEGGASNAPIFLGLLSMTGAFLVSKYTKD
jgi:hypothetical protein